MWNAWKMPRRRRPAKADKSEKRRGSHAHAHGHRKHSLNLEDIGRKASIKDDTYKIPGVIEEEDEGEKGVEETHDKQ